MNLTLNNTIHIGRKCSQNGLYLSVMLLRYSKNVAEALMELIEANYENFMCILIYVQN
jgi:hypothetical protein